MEQYSEHLILSGSTVKQALSSLNRLSQDAILFVVDVNNRLIGSLTDGDVRRGLLNNFTIENKIDDIIQSNPRFIRKGENNIQEIIKYREENYRIIPILDDKDKIINIINFRNLKSYLPLDAIIMAGGRGQRLKPLTDKTPKPLLRIGDKPIIEYNIERLAKYGITDFWLSVKYLGEQIKNYFGDGDSKNINIQYVWEKESLGTIGAVSLIDNLTHDYVLVTNSDLLTDIDFENYFIDFITQNADFSVLTIPYQVNVPYAVLETNGNREIKKFKEKPTSTYYTNGGIYLMKKEVLAHIPKNSFYNATDLMEKLIKSNNKVISYPFSGYWLDIGKHEDFEKAQIDINLLKF